MAFIPDVFIKEIEDLFLGRILDHPDLFKDDAFLFLDVFLFKERVLYQISQDIQGRLKVLWQYINKEERIFFMG